MSDADLEYMARALVLARRGLFSTAPNPRVGCVLVRDGDMVGAGWHRYTGGPHAEVLALEEAGDSARGADCYVTLEPCCHTGKTPPCTRALVDAGVKRVIAAMTDPDPRVGGRGLQALEEAGIRTRVGVLEAAARNVNPGFVKRMTRGLPYVRCKLAMSLDGRTAMADGGSRWITGEEARHDVQRLRARSCAVVTGSGTVIADDPRLTVRDIDTGGRLPHRVVLDRRLRTPPGARLLAEPGRTLIMTLSNDRKLRAALEAAGAKVVVFGDEPGGFLHGCLRYLAGEEQANEVLVEAGATLCGAMVAEALVDELILYQAPVLLGDRTRGLLELKGIERIDEGLRLELAEVRQVGADLRLTLRPGQAG